MIGQERDKVKFSTRVQWKNDKGCYQYASYIDKKEQVRQVIIYLL